MGKKRARSSYQGRLWAPDVTIDEGSTELSEPKEKKTTFASNFQSPPVCILVGPEKTPYHLHSEILSKRCLYFRGRTDFQMKGRPDHQENISFEDTPCEVFDMFVEYTYTSKYTTPTDLSTAGTCELHTRFYCFADFLMMNDLKKDVLSKTKTLLENSHWQVPSAFTSQDIVRLLNIIYDNTMESHTPIDMSWKNEGGPNDEDEESDDQTASQALAFPAIEEIEASKRPRPDPMRVLIARYAALQIETLRKDKDFDRIISDRRGIARDIISFLRPACSF